MKKIITFLLISLILVTPIIFAANESNIQVTKLDNGEVASARDGKKVISSLRKSMIIINDSSCPLNINDTKLHWVYYDRSYRFENSGSVLANDSISAYEIRYVLYDIFNEHIKTLSYIDIKDMKTGDTNTLRASWYANNNQVNNLLTIVAFVSNVRKEDGKIWRCDEKAITNELFKISIGANIEELNPNKDK